MTRTIVAKGSGTPTDRGTDGVTDGSEKSIQSARGTVGLSNDYDEGLASNIP